MLSGGAVARVGVLIPVIHFGHGGSCCCLEKFHLRRNSTAGAHRKGIQLSDDE